MKRERKTFRNLSRGSEEKIDQYKPQTAGAAPRQSFTYGAKNYEVVKKLNIND